MNRLQTELQRLGLPARALVLELTGAGAWADLARAWQGVQADLGLPAPAIAVNGVDGYQLWFALAQAVPDAQAAAFLEMLRTRYLGQVAPERLRTGTPAAAEVPPVERLPGRWSAFVAPDLASVFANEPCLDLAPGADAQADLLSRLRTIPPDDFVRVMAAAVTLVPAAATALEAGLVSGPGPRGFLQGVMNDPAVELALRIDAAKALLPYAPG